jgi:hypothetical protein
LHVDLVRTARILAILASEKLRKSSEGFHFAFSEIAQSKSETPQRHCRKSRSGFSLQDFAFFAAQMCDDGGRLNCVIAGKNCLATERRVRLNVKAG